MAKTIIEALQLILLVGAGLAAAPFLIGMIALGFIYKRWLS